MRLFLTDNVHSYQEFLHKFNDQTVNAFDNIIFNHSKQNENVQTAHAINRDRIVKRKLLKPTTSVGDCCSRAFNQTEESARATLFPLKFIATEIKTKLSLPTTKHSFTKSVKYKLSRQNSKVQVMNYTENDNACSERKECKFPEKQKDITTEVSKSYSVKLKKTTTKHNKPEHYHENMSENLHLHQKTALLK